MDAVSQEKIEQHDNMRTSHTTEPRRCRSRGSRGGSRRRKQETIQDKERRLIEQRRREDRVRQHMASRRRVAKKDETLPSQVIYSINEMFGKYSHPDIPEYLGESQQFSYEDCTTGCMFFSSEMSKLQDFKFECENEISINTGTIEYTIGNTKRKIWLGGVDENSVVEMIIKQIGYFKIQEELISQKYPDVTASTCKEWLDTLVPHTESRPSDSHFMGVIHGLGDAYECKVSENSTGHMCNTSQIYRGFWFERWPTKVEILSMMIISKSFCFGVPSKLHGN